mgnify:CR=1 FL=1
MEWNEIKNSGDIFRVKGYLNNHENGENMEEAKAIYNELRQQLLTEMKANPSRFGSTMVE